MPAHQQVAITGHSSSSSNSTTNSSNRIFLWHTVACRMTCCHCMWIRLCNRHSSRRQRRLLPPTPIRSGCPVAICMANNSSNNKWEGCSHGIMRSWTNSSRTRTNPPQRRPIRPCARVCDRPVEQQQQLPMYNWAAQTTTT